MHPADGRVVSNFIMQALRGEPITIYGEGEQTRSFCYVDDLVDGLIRLMESKPQTTGPINLGNPAEFTIRQLADLVLEMTGAAPRFEFRPLPADDPRQRQPSIALATSVLGWSPRISLAEGLRPTIDYFARTQFGATPGRGRPCGLKRRPQFILRPRKVRAGASCGRSTGREVFAAEQLQRQGFVTFLPKQLKTVRHARKVRVALGAYFPGYLFVEIDLAKDRWRSVNGTLGVSRLIGAEERPTPVPRGVVEALIEAADARGVLTGPPLSAGRRCASSPAPSPTSWR